MTTTLRAAAQQALEALEYHQEQTRPIWRTNKAIEALEAALAEPDVPEVCFGNIEPVALIEPAADNDSACAYADGWNDCVNAHKQAAPPQRLPLTDEEINAVCAPLCFAQLSPVEVARAIEAAHGIGSKT